MIHIDTIVVIMNDGSSNLHHNNGVLISTYYTIRIIKN